MTLWLHVGLHKTGTTTLQEDFFPVLGGLHYLGEKGARLPESDRKIIHRLIGGLKARADQPDEVRGLISLARSWMEKWPAPDRPTLISEEGFSGTWPTSPFDRVALLPRVLRDVFGEGAIVLVVRDPIALLVSMYQQRMERQELTQLHQMFPSDGVPSFDAFLAGEKAHYERGAFDTVFSHLLRFYRVVRSYAAAFGRECVHVLPFEPMVSAPDDYCRAWCRLLGIPDRVIPLARRNASGPDRRQEILRRLGIAAGDPRATEFEAQFTDLPARLGADPLIAGYAERHCVPVQVEAAATYAALTGRAPSATPDAAREATP